MTTAKRHKELNSLGIAYRYTDEHDKARRADSRRDILAERSGDKKPAGFLFANLGVLEIDVGAAESAIDHLDRAVALDRGEARGHGRSVRPCEPARLPDCVPARLIKVRHELREVSRDALAVNDVDLTIGLIELLAMLWAESGDVGATRGFTGRV